MKRMIRQPLTKKGATQLLSRYDAEAVELGREFIDEINNTQIFDVDDDTEIDDQNYIQSRLVFYSMVALDEGLVDDTYEFREIVDALYALDE